MRIQQWRQCASNRYQLKRSQASLARPDSRAGEASTIKEVGLVGGHIGESLPPTLHLI